MFLKFQPINFDAIAHIGLQIVWNDCSNFRWNRSELFWNIDKDHMTVGYFSVAFGLFLAMFPESQPYNFDAIAHIGP